MSWQIGYCTNVHAGNTLEQTRAQLVEHAVAVQKKFAPESQLGVGLWLSSSTASQMLEQQRVTEFADFLAESQLIPYTLNGFPYGDFHREVVRHNVYLPTWRNAARTEYTLQLIRILDQLLPTGKEGSISTVPLGWGNPPWSEVQLTAATEQISRVASYLQQLEDESGRLIYLCLEPEPGCELQRSGDLAEFFEQYLLLRDPERNRRYIRICHDVCHASVMFESQQEALHRYLNVGALIGKVQISSAVVVPFAEMAPEDREVAFAELGQFAEHRYLHQTLVQQGTEQPEFHEDLSDALEQARTLVQSQGGGTLGTWLADQEWRVHFHVPVYLEKFGRLKTSHAEILTCLDILRQFPELKHLEVETYAWNVLPPALRHEQLADGIAAEMDWLQSALTTPQNGA